jgi:hypothetical protein
MIRRRLCTALVVTMVLLLGVPVAFADDWCSADPLVKVVTPGGSQQYVHITVAGLGAEHRRAVQQATIGWEAIPADGGTKVTITATVPQDGAGSFQTRAQVSARPFGGGQMLGSTTGTAGTVMVVSYQVAVR